MCVSGHSRNQEPLRAGILSLSLAPTRGFPGGISGKEPASQCRRSERCGFDPWVGKILWSISPEPAPVFLPGESLQRSLACYSPWGCKESDMTEVM